MKLLASGDDQVNESGTTVPGETSHWGERSGCNELSCVDISGDDCEGQHRDVGTRRFIRRGHQREHPSEHGVTDAMLWSGRSESERIARRTGLLRCRQVDIRLGRTDERRPDSDLGVHDLHGHVRVVDEVARVDDEVQPGLRATQSSHPRTFPMTTVVTDTPLMRRGMPKRAASRSGKRRLGRPSRAGIVVARRPHSSAIGECAPVTHFSPELPSHAAGMGALRRRWLSVRTSPAKKLGSLQTAFAVSAACTPGMTASTDGPTAARLIGITASPSALAPIAQHPTGDSRVRRVKHRGIRRSSASRRSEPREARSKPHRWTAQRNIQPSGEANP